MIGSPGRVEVDTGGELAPGHSDTGPPDSRDRQDRDLGLRHRTFQPAEPALQPGAARFAQLEHPDLSAWAGSAHSLRQAADRQVPSRHSAGYSRWLAAPAAGL